MPFSDRLDPSQHPWLQAPGLCRVIDALNAGGETRIVGGAVRDALLGREVKEVDLATTLPPERVMEILTEAGLKVVPTGLKHGTVTAVSDHKGYEITTLRRDIATDGRHAEVVFTDDWQADAARRDFTFNALFLDSDGRIHDYFGGREDLAAGRVRFIGEAKQRIEEDVLRILRFFRFHAWFGRGPADEAGLRACQDGAKLLANLSVERVWNEISKLLNAPDPLEAWRLMHDSGALAVIAPEAKDLDRLRHLLALENLYEVAPMALRRLAALLPRQGEVALNFARRLKLSTRETETLRALATLPVEAHGRLDPVPFRRFLYAQGAEKGRDAALLSGEEASPMMEAALALAAAWERPVFPLTGADIMALGVSAGPKLGEILHRAEDWWIDQDFHADRAACLEAAQKLSKDS
jgi:poly(A) polymerase